jgi:hypothetical protein
MTWRVSVCQQVRQPQLADVPAQVTLMFWARSRRTLA